MPIKENKTNDIRKYLKDYYNNNKVMVKCDRCDCEVNSFSLKQHYKTRLCTRIAKLSEVDINKKLIDKEINSLFEKQNDIYKQIKNLSFVAYDISNKIKNLDNDYIIINTPHYTLEEYNAHKEFEELKQIEQLDLSY
jgi:hypothetical protein